MAATSFRQDEDDAVSEHVDSVSMQVPKQRKVRKLSWNSAVRELIIREWTGKEFRTDDLYKHEAHFKHLFPANSHIVPGKLMQIMCDLCNDGFTERIASGTYRQKNVLVHVPKP
jgi:hypothetical protein